MSKRPIATQDEVPFSLDELFFSRTDTRGVISYGNSVFVRVSGYPREVILGSPHNLVRHPDMPRTIFKVFWEMLKAGKPIVAYVKNMSSTGAHYWVLAAAFPLEEGYLSIRVKPSSRYFAPVIDLYHRMLAAESKGGMDAAKDMLDGFVKEAGFESYEHFMTRVLVAEIQSRDGQLKANEDEDARTLARLASSRDLSGRCADCALRISDVFDRLDLFSKTYATFVAESRAIGQACSSLKYNALNMLVTSAREGRNAASLGVIAQHFQLSAEAIRDSLEDFNKATDLEKSIRSVELDLASARLQVDMMAFFVANEPDVNEMLKQVANLLGLANAYVAKAEASIDHVATNLTVFMGVARDLRQHLRTLRVLNNSGAIEAAQTAEEAFGPQLKALSAFVTEANDSTDRIERDVRDLLGNIGIAVDGLSYVRRQFEDAEQIVERSVSPAHQVSMASS